MLGRLYYNVLFIYRLSPKTNRKDRGRQLRSKRERASSPVSKDKTPTSSRSRSGSQTGECVKEPVKEAMAPSVSECMRSVFAAFMWHEGIVHDAMACASFLKFHPNLAKEMPKLKGGDNTPKSGRVTPSGTLKKHSRQSSSECQNLNEAVKTTGDLMRTKERCYSESSSKASQSTVSSEQGDTPSVVLNRTEEQKESDLPLTLQYLVYFWEELSTVTLKVITQNLILPSPAVHAKARKMDKKDKEKNNKEDKKSKKKKEVKPAAGGRGNLFGDAAGGLFGGGERETMCELCGGLYPHPVTYHMRQAHPGCGRHAGGQGYNSGGNFCGGWAGNCGDGGIGGSTWYLMCDRCREKYLREKRQALKEKTKKTKKKSTPVKQASAAQVLESHYVMKNNAMYLLELSSSAGFSLPSRKQGMGIRLDNMLPSVSEDSLSEQCPFPPVPFLYLCQRGAQGADSAFAEDVIFGSEEHGLSMVDVHSQMDGPHFSRSESIGEPSHINQPSRTPVTSNFKLH